MRENDIKQLILFANSISPKVNNAMLLHLPKARTSNEWNDRSSLQTSQKIASKWMDFRRRRERVKKIPWIRNQKNADGTVW